MGVNINWLGGVLVTAGVVLVRSSVDVGACAKQCCVMKRIELRTAVLCISSLSYLPTKTALKLPAAGY